MKVIWLLSDGVLTPGCLTLDTVPLHCIYLHYLIIPFIYFGYCVSPLLKYKLLEDTHLCVFSPVSLST